MNKLSIIVLFTLLTFISLAQCYIKPQETPMRKTKNLDGLWKFKLAPELGLEETRQERTVIKDENDKKWISMPVPSSFNDITQEPEIRDYVGWFWYKREFIIHNSFYNLADEDLFIHFGSVNYYCEVFINDMFIGKHSGGHLPFEFQISLMKSLNLNGKNTIKVLANNILTLGTTIPQGNTHYPKNTTNTIYPPGFKATDIWFDFFNYAGIHRSVTLLTKRKTRIENVNFNFLLKNETVYLNFSVETTPLNENEFVQVSLIDQNDEVVLKKNGPTGETLVPNPKLWWPYTMNANQPPHLYRLNVKILYRRRSIIDLPDLYIEDFNSTSYDLIKGTHADEIEIRTGIRFIEIINNRLFINSRHAYLTGFGKHEDSDVRGRGLDLPLLVKDFNLIKWIQANTFRTSHYPYSEELMDLADEYGVLIIDEVPAVSLINFQEYTLNVHKQQLEELINRDKHHPSVIFWSVANEAESQKPESNEYFKEVTRFARSLDPTRLITAAINKPVDGCYLSQYLDVIMLNRYVSWYSNGGRVELIRNQINYEFDLFFKKYGKPMMISEYGADTVSGFHQSPPRMFSEDYQVEYLRHHFEAFDDLISEDQYFIGELYWNFADFMTKADYTRVLGNKKGLFTRDRQPKASAKIVRCRYAKLAAQLDLRKFEMDYEMFC